ncbi:hypothetical protein RND71_005465 [Anisodus tanguticus]|uniref:Uncharacterized protein n=1 Tax=Anisodus tanguticus TaxID=243964 RepID=A0AAE1SP32_9SOLA|nr:hypothetical protein RND71_005465 [Anisodus tanguticus]
MKEVEENLNDVPLPEVGGKVTLSLFDPIEENVFEMELVTVNHDEVNSSSAEFIWEKVIDRNMELDDQLVNNSYYYQITYQLRGTNPQKKSKQLGKTTENSSAHASTTTTTTTARDKNNSKGKCVVVPEYDSDDAYWLSYDN